MKNAIFVFYFLWPPSVADACIIFLSCFFFLSAFFSSPNLSSPRMDVYHTLTHDVVLVRTRMQVWNMLHAARWKCRTQKLAKKSPSGHHRTTLSGHIFATKARIDNRKKPVKQHYLLHMSSQYGELRPTTG